MILAIRAIWACWNDGTKLDFRGDFYTHTLMTPFFNPGPNPHGDARIFLAGVGELMTEVAGEVADGFICHGFTTRRYLDEVTLPHLEKGRTKAGKTMDGFELMGPMFVVTGRDEAEMARGRRRRAPADRLLRVDARLPQGARAARLGRPAGRPQPHVEGGALGGDGRARRPTRSSASSPWSPRSTRWPPASTARWGDVLEPHQLLRPVRGRDRSVGPGDRRPQGGLSRRPDQASTRASWPSW